MDPSRMPATHEPNLIIESAGHIRHATRIPLEIFYTIIDISDIPTLKSWTTVCRCLLPSARYHLFSRAVLCLRRQLHATNLLGSSSRLSTLAQFSKSLYLSCSPEETTCWFPDILAQSDHKLEGIHTLTLDFTGAHVDGPLFANLMGLSRNMHLNTTLLPDLRHLELIGSETIPAYYVLGVVSLFPRLETLKTTKFRWNVTSRQYSIPFPSSLHLVEADIGGIQFPATFFLSFFTKNEDQRESSSFFMRINSSHTKPLLDSPDDPDDIFEPQHRHYFSHILKGLGSLIPNVEHIKLEVPMDEVKNEIDTRALLMEQRLLQGLQSLTVNNVEVIRG